MRTSDYLRMSWPAPISGVGVTVAALLLVGCATDMRTDGRAHTRSCAVVEIPKGAKPFYISDAYTRNNIPSNAKGARLEICTGPANQDLSYSANTHVTAYVIAGSLALVPVTEETSDGMAGDIQLGFYRVDTTPVEWTGIVLGFTPPYGTAANGQLIHATTLFGRLGEGRRYFGPGAAVTVAGTTPNGPPEARYQVGPRILVHYGSYPRAFDLQIQYHVHGVTAVP
ncbi:hypothetical protein LCGC14_1833280 [marine sediment metagenome]|uniref:Uncharacterized protein n=1 Tax=marine sediment metagenome TaxID=412755 RepID=A0A0F9GFK7_9ZZZZ